MSVNDRVVGYVQMCPLTHLAGLAVSLQTDNFSVYLEPKLLSQWIISIPNFGCV
jgi:hypothetical protein